MNGHTGLADVMQMVPATILIGLSTVAGAFSQAIVQQMASRVARPIIFPLSNPTSCAEATPEALIQWTEGRALIATGSPFPPVLYQGKSLPIAQCNNIYIFPAIGLALTSGGATRVTDSMLLAAAETLGRLSPAIDAPSAPLLPALEHVHTAVQHMAFAVAKQAIADGVAPDMSDEVLLDCIHKCQWMPAYA
jgi:malate dehydrogenase (oxaloacetate-decarboxylating)